MATFATDRVEHMLLLRDVLCSHKYMTVLDLRGHNWEGDVWRDLFQLAVSKNRNICEVYGCSDAETIHLARRNATTTA